MIITFTYRILISCPGDVHNAFMGTIKEAVDEYNERISDRYTQRRFERMFGHRISVEILYWREDSIPIFLVGASGQDILNEQLVDTADGTIGLFYTNIGTPTDKYESGTVEEIEKTLERNKHVAVIPIVDDCIPTALLVDDGKEYTKLKSYLRRIRDGKRGLIIDCSSENLKKTLLDQFDSIVYFEEEANENFNTITLTR